MTTGRRYRRHCTVRVRTKVDFRNAGPRDPTEHGRGDDDLADVNTFTTVTASKRVRGKTAVSEDAFSGRRTKKQVRDEQRGQS